MEDHEQDRGVVGPRFIRRELRFCASYPDAKHSGELTLSPLENSSRALMRSAGGDLSLTP